jgi:hypothetical protein
LCGVGCGEGAVSVSAVFEVMDVGPSQAYGRMKRRGPEL